MADIVKKINSLAISFFVLSNMARGLTLGIIKIDKNDDEINSIQMSHISEYFTFAELSKRVMR